MSDIAPHKFQPGNPGGPGRPPMTPEQRAAKAAEKKFYEEYLAKLRKLEPKLLKVYKQAFKAATETRIAVTKDGEAVELDPGAAEISAGLKAVDSVSNRLFGQPKQKTELTGEDGGPLEVSPVYNLDNLNAAERDQLGYLLRKARSGTGGEETSGQQAEG